MRCGASRKFLRRLVPRWRLDLRAAVARVPFPSSDFFRPSTQRSALLRLIFPGWSHLFLGQRGGARFFFWAFLATLLPGLLLIGSTHGSILLGLAFSIHVSCAADVVGQLSPAQGVAVQIGRAIGLSAIMFAVLYLPIGSLILYLANPQVIQIGMGNLQQGDVVLVDHTAYRSAAPAIGDVVIYNVVQPSSVRTARGGLVYLAQGPRVDRILAGPLDRVEIRAGRLLVNGKPSSLRPVNPSFFPLTFDLEVPKDQYLIFPSTTPNLGAMLDTPTLINLSLVSRSHVVGRVRLRSYPPSRFGRL